MCSSWMCYYWIGESIVVYVIKYHMIQYRAGAKGPASQVLAWPLFTKRTPSSR